jgi:tRNA(Ile)-lysidine synthase
VPGAVTFGAWHLEASAGEIGDAVLAGDELGDVVTVRAWRDGDRMRPAGLGGSKSLQDIFTDRKVPRELRRSLPVVEAGRDIAWVAGVAVGERFRAKPGHPPVALTARLHSAAPDE